MKVRLVRFVIALFLLSFANSGFAQQIKARYINESGTTIKLQITIGSPAPQNIIIEQYIPPGTKIISTSPAAKKKSQKNGVVKWLLKGLSPGKRVISMKLSPPLSRKAHGKLRYRDPQNGNLVEKSF